MTPQELAALKAKHKRLVLELEEAEYAQRTAERDYQQTVATIQSQNIRITPEMQAQANQIRGLQ